MGVVESGALQCMLGGGGGANKYTAPTCTGSWRDWGAHGTRWEGDSTGMLPEDAPPSASVADVNGWRAAAISTVSSHLNPKNAGPMWLRCSSRACAESK